ncbi:MAG: hypothetical protein J1D77_08625 [Muribaculaceae bacterium]|nr:hypothetical protein [Muribaculaceae bacterium]
MKRTIKLTLSLSEIVYDIQNKTYLTGRSLKDEKSDHGHIANMQANDDDENAAQILRSVTMACAILRNRLSEYLSDGDSNSDNASVEAGEDLQLTLKMPSNFNDSVSKTIGEAAHQFIVATAVADWFAITARGETSDYAPIADAALRTLEEALNKRSRPLRAEASA